VESQSTEAQVGSERLERISERLAGYALRYDLMRDSRAIFTRTYSIMTRIIAQKLQSVQWEDVEWIVKLAEAFSSRYFLVLEKYDDDSLTEGAWQHAFVTFARSRLSALEISICGMACHIIHDLPLSLADARFQDNGPNARITDYHSMNGVLDDAIDTIIATISRKYNPTLQ
jgi:hypothetical protein